MKEENSKEEGKDNGREMISRADACLCKPR
jgi:hypothetical protein